jgi:hypothetical protein
LTSSRADPNEIAHTRCRAQFLILIKREKAKRTRPSGLS